MDERVGLASNMVLRHVAACLVALGCAFGCSEPRFDETREADAQSAAPIADAALADVDAGHLPDADARDAEAARDVEVVRDAEADSARASDASAKLDSSPSSASLPGQYGAIARFRARDTAGLGWLWEEIVSLAEISDDGRADSLRMDWEVCDISTHVFITLVPEIKSSILYPQKLQRREFRVIVEGDRFRTVGGTLRFGFRELTAAECPPGTKQRHPDRPWLPNGECTCAASTALPTRIDDCRVVDDDGDSYPATTVIYTGGSENLAFTVSRDQNQLVDGVIDPQRNHRASYLPSGETYQLKCRTGTCTRGSVSFCPAKANPARFVPLTPRADGAAWTCADVLREIHGGGGVWGLDAPVDPTGNPDC